MIENLSFFCCWFCFKTAFMLFDWVYNLSLEIFFPNKGFPWIYFLHKELVCYFFYMSFDVTIHFWFGFFGGVSQVWLLPIFPPKKQIRWIYFNMNFVFWYKKNFQSVDILWVRFASNYIVLFNLFGVCFFLYIRLHLTTLSSFNTI